MTDKAAGKRILFLSGLQIFPAGSGGQLRSSGLIERIAENGFEVTVYSLVGRKPDYLVGKRSEFVAVGKGITEYIDRTRLWAFVQLLCYRLHLPPIWIPLLLSWFIPKTLRRMLAEADQVVIDFPFLYPAVRGFKKPVYLNTHNIEADLWRNPAVKALVRRIERLAAQRADAVVCCSRQDLDFFAKIVGAERVLYVPNGIDTRRFDHLDVHRADTRSRLGFDRDARVLLFAASSFGPNVEGFEFICRFVEQNRAFLRAGNLHFLIVGSVSKSPLTRPHLAVTGPVPKVEPYFAAADYAINAVFRGSGTNVKMCEYMAARLPILTTDAGRRGFDLRPDDDCIVFTPETLASLLETHPALASRDLAARMAASAYERNRVDISMREAVSTLIQRLHKN